MNSIRKGLDSRRFSTASIHEGADSIALIPSAGDEETALNPYYNSEQIGPHPAPSLPLNCSPASLEWDVYTNIPALFLYQLDVVANQRKKISVSIN